MRACQQGFSLGFAGNIGTVKTAMVLSPERSRFGFGVRGCGIPDLEKSRRATKAKAGWRLGLVRWAMAEFGCVSASGVQRSARPTFFGEKCACFQSVESCGGADPFACWGCQRRIAANIALPSPQGALDKNTIKLLTDTFPSTLVTPSPRSGQCHPLVVGGSTLIY